MLCGGFPRAPSNNGMNLTAATLRSAAAGLCRTLGGTLYLIPETQPSHPYRMSPSDFDLELQELHRKSVGRLLTAETFDRSAFEALKAYLCEKAEHIKSEHVISKQVLDCLLSAWRAIESRAEYMPDARKSVAMAAEFFMLLDLMVGGEGCNDRKAGVPRVL